MTCLRIAALVAVVACAACDDRPCVSGHMEHRGMWMQPILVGKVIVPIVHPATEVFVCDARLGPRR